MTQSSFVIRAMLVAGVGTLLVAAPGAQSRVARIIQTNAAGDNAHVIDPVTNKVVGVIEVPHGGSASPDGRQLFITNESLSTVDAIDPKTWKVVKRIPLTGHPN